MRSASRHLAVVAIIVALVAGLWTPMSARWDPVDADGVCGPQVVQGRSAARVDVDRAVAATGHCLACHLRHDMAGAFVSSVLQIISPLGSVELLATHPIDRHGILLYDDAAPRGPPVRS